MYFSCRLHGWRGVHTSDYLIKADGSTLFLDAGDLIDRHWDGIAAYCRPENRVSLGFVEGLNNKIGVLQRRECGLCDQEYFRLKVLTLHASAGMIPQNHPLDFAKNNNHR